MPRSHRHEIGVGLLVLAALALLAWMSLQVGALSGLRDSVHVAVLLPDASGLTEGAPVKVAGIEIGKVDRLTIEHDQARIAMVIDRDAEIRQDAVVQVRARSVLGEKFIAIIPQSTDAALLQDGELLTRWRGQTEIDELVNALGPLIDSVDPQTLDQAMSALSRALAEDPDRLGRMLRDADTVLHNAALASEQLPALVDETRVTLEQTREAVAQARPVLRKADALTAHLDQVATELPQTMGKLDALLSDSQAMVADGQRLVQHVDASSDDLARVLDNLSEIDKWELRRLIREEGVTIRLRPKKIEPE